MSSLLLLIDGYNLVAPSAPPSRGAVREWLQREREQLMKRLAGALDPQLCRRTCVVFDAAQPVEGRPSEYDFQGISVRFAVDHDEADDLLEDLIRDNSAPRRLAVISSDGRVQQAARRRGSTVYEAQVWLDELLDGVVGLADGVRIEAGKGRGDRSTNESDVKVSADEARSWMREFGYE